VLENELRGWFDEVDAGLKDKQNLSPASAAEFIAESVEYRDLMAELLTILHTVLEQNIRYAAALHFREWFKTRLWHTGLLLENSMPFLSAGEGLQLITQIHALMMGFYLIANPSPVVKRVLRKPDLKMFEIQFRDEFRKTLQTLIQGLQWISASKVLGL
jgi:hypothetical protein